jgi:hypothetical protein
MIAHIQAWWNSLLLSLSLRLLARSYSVVSIYAPKREGIEAAVDYVESKSL